MVPRSGVSRLVGLALCALAAGAEGHEASTASPPPESESGVFPNYDDPITAAPPLPHPKASGGQPCATVQPLVDAQCTGFGQVVRGHYEPPRGCEPARWDQVVLELTGAVKGVQFDRYGALWLRGTEILRLTTPEPSPEGVAWKVVKDLSEYAELFQSPGEVALMIPNVVDSTYTGALNINVSISFYGAAAEGGAEKLRLRPRVLPLRNVSGLASPLGAVESNSAVGQVNILSLPRDIREAHLDLYASGHGCEEFWYTNAINATDPGSCGGGAYRELNVFVDGHLAGAQHPFPVIYTGGVNPILWRPLTGILSFDIPAYHFDLTPFLGWLNDGKPHNITLAVVDNWKGTWYLDGVLIMYEDDGGVASGTVELVPHQTHEVRQGAQDMPGVGLVQNMTANSSFHAKGTLLLRSGDVVTSEVKGVLSAWSKNLVVDGGNTQNTVGAFHSTTTSLRDGFVTKVVRFDFPLEVNDSSSQDNTTFQMEACVKYARDLQISFGGDLGDGYGIGSFNSMHTCAVYNRTTTEPRVVNVQTNNAKEDFSITSDSMFKQNCYHRSLGAKDGAVTSSKGHGECQWDRGVYPCGSDVCGSYGGAWAAPVSFTSFGHGAASGIVLAEPLLHASLAAAKCSLPVRRPWHKVTAALMCKAQDPQDPNIQVQRRLSAHIGERDLLV